MKLMQIIACEMKNCGKSRPCIGYTAMKESDAKKHLGRQIKKCDRNKPPIIVSHTPPYGVLDIGRRFGIEHLGSVELNDFVLKNEIPLVICGHVHGYGGHMRKLDKTTVVNVSSHDRPGSEGNIAVIDYDDTVSVKWVKASDYDGSLRKIRDIGVCREMLLRSNGIKTMDDLLACTDTLLTGLKTQQIVPRELKRFLSIAENDKEKLILTLMFKYNLSKRDLEKLALKQLNFDRKTVYFRRSDGKDIRRYIFLDDETCQSLLNYASKRQFKHGDPIFFSSSEDQNTVNSLFKKVKKISESLCCAVEPKGGIGKILGKELIERAKAYSHDKPIIYNRVTLPKNLIFVDIETSPIGIDSSHLDLGSFYTYLIGVYDEENGYQCFITKEKKPKEKLIFKEFLDYLADLENREYALCAYNGNNFDFKHLDHGVRSNRLSTKNYKKLKKIDLLEICRKNLYVPKGYSLASVASCFGYTFKHPEKNGYHMGLEYQGFLLGTLEEPDWEDIIEKNKDDVLAMKHIIERIQT